MSRQACAEPQRSDFKISQSFSARASAFLSLGAGHPGPELARVTRAGGPRADGGLRYLRASSRAVGFRPANDPRLAEIDAHVTAQLRFPSGAAAQVVSSSASAGLNMVEARGTEAELVMRPATNYGGNTLALETGRERRGLTPGDSCRRWRR